MKVIYFIRHAKSSWADSSLRDFDRPLNKRGQRDAPFMGKLMNAKASVPDLLVSSPAARARATAEHFAHALGLPPEGIAFKPDIYEALPGAIMETIQQLDESLQTVMLFGHNPTLTSIANLFAEEPIANVPTCGVFKVEATVERWEAFNESVGRLTEFHYPKQYFS